MTSVQKKQLARTIRKLVKETREEIENLKILTLPVSPDNAIGRLSRMDAINNKSINEKALREKKTILQKLERASERIQKDDFGKCNKCGSEIAFGRLECMPWTTRCVNCA